MDIELARMELRNFMYEFAFPAWESDGDAVGVELDDGHLYIPAGLIASVVDCGSDTVEQLFDDDEIEEDYVLGAMYAFNMIAELINAAHDKVTDLHVPDEYEVDEND